MNKVLYHKICKELSRMPPETGGILGSQKESLITFYYDETGSRSEKCYIPDVELLNQKIIEWQAQDIDFAGIVHSHWQNKELSAQDIRYGRQVARAFDHEVLMGVYVYNTKELYLYVVSTDERVPVYLLT